MVIDNEVLYQIITFAISHPYLVSFIGLLFFGETVLLILGLLSGYGLIPFWGILVFSILGSIVSDIGLYAIGRIIPQKAVSKLKFISRAFKKAENFLHKITKKNYFNIILFTKLAYGIRTIMLIYIGYKKFDFRKFLSYNIGISFVLIFIVLGVGWLAGQGIGNVINIFQNTKRIVMFVVSLVILLYVVRYAINEFLSRKKKL